MAVGAGIGEGSAVASGSRVGIATGVVGAVADVGEGCGGSLAHPTKENAARVRAVSTIRAWWGRDKLEFSRCPVREMCGANIL